MSKGEGKKKEEDIVFIRKIIYQMREKNIRGRNKRKMGKVGGRKSWRRKNESRLKYEVEKMNYLFERMNYLFGKMNYTFGEMNYSLGKMNYALGNIDYAFGERYA